jgi:hypothetical protein
MNGSNLGIHLLGNETHGGYFVERHYGNYLFFPGQIEKVNNSFLQSKGGVYKQFETNLNISAVHEQLFRTYGASLVSEVEAFHNAVRIELYPTEFKDEQLRPCVYGFVLKQRDSKVLFLHEDILLQENHMKFLSDKFDVGKFEEFVERQDISWFFFSNYENINHLQREEFKNSQISYQLF